MNRVKTHKDLDIWRRGIELVVHIYEATQSFPKEEAFGLKAQMRRASVSYPSNVSEGAARSSAKEYVHYLYVALASLSELETQVVIAERLKYLDGSGLFEEIEALRRKTLNYIKYVKSKQERRIA